MDSKLKKHWWLAASGIAGATLLTVWLGLSVKDPAPEHEDAPRDDHTTETEPPVANEPEPKTPEENLPDESDQSLNAADQCFAYVVENRIIPSLEYWTREFRTAVEVGLYVDPQPEIRRIESVAADEFARCIVQNGMENSEASDTALEKMENAKQNFIKEFTP